MEDSIIEKLYSFLVGQSAPVASSVLVREVLNIRNAAELMANTLLSPLLKSDARFTQMDDGRWLAKPAQERADDDWLVCKIFPASTDWRKIAAVCCARLHNGAIVDKICFSENLYQNDAAGRISEYLLNAPLMFDGIGGQPAVLRQYLLHMSGASLQNPIVLLKSVVKCLFPESSCRSEADIARALGQPEFADASVDIQFESFCRQAVRAFELLHGSGVNTLVDLQDFVAIPKETPDFDSFGFDASFIENAPKTPGVYIMKNEAAKVIYVGKSKSLRRRLKSYLEDAEGLDEKLRRIRNELFDIELIQTGSELEALFLENDLIKEYKPKINRQLDVHNRDFLQSQRFAQIVLLPAIEETKVALLLFNPAHTAKLLVVDRERNNEKLERELNTIFFERKIDDHASDMEEIAMSWLSTNHLALSRVDMRFVVTLEEALRLVKAQIKEFEAGRSIVCI